MGDINKMVLILLIVVLLMVYENTFKDIEEVEVRQKHNLIYGVLLFLLFLRVVLG